MYSFPSGMLVVRCEGEEGKGVGNVEWVEVGGMEKPNSISIPAHDRRLDLRCETRITLLQYRTV